MMEDEKSIVFKESNLFTKCIIELPPSLIFTNSVFLKQYCQHVSTAEILNNIFNIVKNNIKLYRKIKLNSYSSFANNGFYIQYYRSLIKTYKDFNNNNPVNTYTAYSIINFINFSIYTSIAMLINSPSLFGSYWYNNQVYFKDSIININSDSLLKLENVFSFYLNPLIVKIDTNHVFTTTTNKLIDKFSLTIMQQNDNKK